MPSTIGSEPQKTCRSDDRSTPARSSSSTVSAHSWKAKFGATVMVTRCSVIAWSQRAGCCTKCSGVIISNGQPPYSASMMVPMSPMS